MARRGGWRRLGRKRFRYVDGKGHPLEDEADLERIRGLAIPPAWREVWISPSPRAKLQATGVDRAGRRQYIYHAEYRAHQDRVKFERLLRFGASLPAFRGRVRRHLRLESFDERWTCAVAASLINHAWFRVGSDRSARSSRSYGVTTLTKRHTSVEGAEVSFCFRAKGRTLVRRKVRNPVLARSVGELLALPGGSRLFRFERGGELVNLTATALNEYIGEYLGEEYTAKDFRTWGGTLVAAVALAEYGAPASEAEAKRAIAAAMRRVGRELANTPTVARASYVSPAVVEHYEAGRTLEDFRQDGTGPSNLTVDERSLLALLRAPRP